MARGDGRVYQRSGSTRWWIQFSTRGRQYREPGGKTEGAARRKLRDRLAEIHVGKFVGPAVERVTVGEVLDAYMTHQENVGLRSLRTLRVHLKPIRAAFDSWRVADLTSTAIEDYQRDRKLAGKAPATICRELEALRAALRHAELPRIPTIRLPKVENTRVGFFTVAEVRALLQHITDDDVSDFIGWAFCTGMRRGEISRLDWSMLDRTSSTWVLRIPGTITKNKTGRAFGFDGEARTIFERRIQARRLDCPLIFHRAGRPMGPFRDLWRAAVKAAGLPPNRLVHDLRRSAVRHLIRAGVDPSIAMKVSGHKTRSMLDRYNIITETETAAALKTVDAYLLTQPATRNVIAVGDSTGPERRLSADEGWCRRWDLNPH